MKHYSGSGFGFYRCRLCGEVERSKHYVNAPSQLEHARSGDGGGDVARRVHHCADGRMGVSDFAGVELDE